MSLASTIGLTIQLPKFEGPLSLLLYLIKKEEMDIFDIEIHRITNQYFEYIRQMKEMDLEVAGEFVAMAATLIQIKSQLLLPTYNEAGEVIEVEDPRKELVQRLLEYQKYQDAARELAKRPWLGRDVWNRGFKEKWEELNEEIELEDNALFSLISSYRKAIRSVQKRIHKVAAKTQSVASRIMEIKDRLFINQRVAMGDLINSVDDRRKQVLMTFLSALELAKMGFVRLFQSEHQQEIYIEAIKEIDASGISRVEEYEKVTDTPLIEEGVAPDAVAEAPSAQLELSEDFELASSGLGEPTPEEPEDEGVEMATDEEILAAEQELAGIVIDEEVLEESLELTEQVEDVVELIEDAEAGSEVQASSESEISSETVEAIEHLQTDAVESLEVVEAIPEEKSDEIKVERDSNPTSVASLTANAASMWASNFGNDKVIDEGPVVDAPEKPEGEIDGSQEI